MDSICHCTSTYWYHSNARVASVVKRCCQFHGTPPVKPVDLSCNWFKACREMQYTTEFPTPTPPKQAFGVVKYQCCWTTIANYLVGCSAVNRKVSAGGAEALACVSNRPICTDDIPLSKVWTYNTQTKTKSTINTFPNSVRSFLAFLL